MHTLLKKTISIFTIMGLFFSLFSNAITPLSQVLAAEVCTTQTVQGWTVGTVDITDANFTLSYNGEILHNADYTSLNDIIKDSNTIFQQHHDKHGIPLYSLSIQDDVIYITESDINPLDIKTDVIEIQLYDNSTSSKIIVDKDNTDGGYNEGLLYRNIDIKTCKRNTTTTCTTVQGWKLNGTDFSSIEGILYYNGEKVSNTINTNAIEKVIAEFNSAYKKYSDEKGIIGVTFIYDNTLDIIYIADSENNSLDSKKDIIEITISNTNDNSEIVGDKNQEDGGQTDGLLYSDQDINCELPPEENQCTPMNVQGWLLNGTDFSNMKFGIYYNGDYVSSNNYQSINDLISETNQNIILYQEKNGGILYSLTVKNNIIYIVDSDKNPLDSSKDGIEIIITNNNDNSEIIRDKEETDGGFNDGLLYSDQEIPCELPPEENQCTPMTVQGWLLNGTDFSNISLIANYNGKEIFRDAGYTSIDQLLQNINKAYNEFAIKNEITTHTFAYNSDMNIIYLVDSDKNPLNSSKDGIEIIMTNNTDNSDIIQDKKQTDGGYSDGLLYSNQNISNCNSENPTELDVPEFVCVHKMKGFDINIVSMSGVPSDIYFHGVEDETNSEGKYISTPTSQINNAEIQIFLNNIYGENKVIRYFNEDDNTVTVRYDSETINPKNIYILMGDSKQYSNKFNGGDNITANNLCPIDKPIQPEIIQKAICTPSPITSSDQKIVCEFTITNEGPGIAYDMTYNGIALPNGFKIIDQGFPDVTSMDVGDSLTYKFIGTQSILPKSGSEIITIGDLNLMYYDNTKAEYNISMNTTIELKRSSRGNNSSSSSSNNVVTEPIKTNPIIIPINTTTGINNQSTGTIVSSGTTITATGVVHNTGSANNIIITDNSTTGTINTGNNKPVITEPIKEEIIQEVPIMELTQYCAYETPIPTNAWQDINTEYANDIKHLISKCIVNGLDNEMLYYGPHKVIKKAEVVKIISKWFKLSIPKNDSNNRWKQYLSSMQTNKALVGLEDTRNESTMNEGVQWGDIIIILKNINPDANLDLIKSFSTKRVSRQAFANVITRQ